jgi:glycerophosphoryl diester phosphodiesterase
MNVLNLVEKGINTYFACWPRAKPILHHPVQLIAHRGAHTTRFNCIENTHKAFELAVELGCWGIELDIQATADGVLLVNHDPTLKRFWGIDSAIANMDYAQVRKLAPQVPTLAEVVERYGKKVHLFIEIKAPFSNSVALVNTLQSLTPCVDYHLITLDETVFESLVDFPKKSLLLVAVHNNVARFCELSLFHNYGGVLGHYLLLNDDRNKTLLAASQSVGVGFVDSKYSLYREIQRGLQWIFSDNVLDVTAYLKELQGITARL